MNEPAAPSRRPRAMRAAAFVVSILVVTGLLSVLPSSFVAPAAAAVDSSSFDPGFIISDEEFFNGTAMTATQIQSFLSTKGANCSGYTLNGVRYTCIKDFRLTINSQAADAQCAAYSGGSNLTAATIIAKVAKACNVNPKVLIVTLQKEQGLITGAKNDRAYNFAMGWGCPDTPAGCSTAAAGFAYQIYRSAWQFQRYRLYPDSFNFKVGKHNIQYHPNTSCGTKSVTIRNQATAGLYNYTPYTPNAAALSAGYGTGTSCSSYGNRNFWLYYSDWFGNPANPIKNPFFKTMASWSRSTTALTAGSYTSATNSYNGSTYAIISSTAKSARLQQTTSGVSKPGQIWQGEIWVRTSAESGTIQGRLVLAARGGTQEAAFKPFTATQTWTKVEVELPIRLCCHSSFFFAVELSTTGAKLRISNAMLVHEASQERLMTFKVEQEGIGTGANGGWMPGSASNTALLASNVLGPKSGAKYIQMTSSVAGAMMYQRIARETTLGTSYVMGAWVRSGDPDLPFTGRLRLRAVTGTIESAETSFTVGNQWVFVSTSIDIASAGHTALRVEVLSDSPGQPVLVDAITLKQNLIVSDSSFEEAKSAVNGTASSTRATRMAPEELTAAGLPNAADGDSLLLIEQLSGTEGYVRIDRSRVLAPGQVYTATIRYRSATAGVPVTGVLALKARSSAGAEDVTEKNFTADDIWRTLTVTHTVTGDAKNLLRVQVFTEAVGASLLIDGVVVR